jgi:two-component system sensor kinase FixL
VRRLQTFVNKSASLRVLIDLDELVRDVAKFVEPDIRQTEAKLVLYTDGSSPNVLVDEIQVQQVLVNLIRNAIDAMQQTPSSQREVTVSTQIRPDGQAEVIVSDVGKGLAKDELEQVFNTFFSTKQEGMGMGLPISRSIIEAHGGKLWAEPNSGPGVTFGFTIPQKERS